VLHVDDNPDVVITFSEEVVRCAGHEVSTANDGPPALRVAQEQNPDLVLLDIGLPQMDGFEIVRRLRQTPGGEK